jgi:hypothetical protein
VRGRATVASPTSSRFDYWRRSRAWVAANELQALAQCGSRRYRPSASSVRAARLPCLTSARRSRRRHPHVDVDRGRARRRASLLSTTRAPASRWLPSTTSRRSLMSEAAAEIQERASLMGRILSGAHNINFCERLQEGPRNYHEVPPEPFLINCLCRLPQVFRCSAILEFGDHRGGSPRRTGEAAAAERRDQRGAGDVDRFALVGESLSSAIAAADR